ncbi:MAG: signal peptidase II [Oscillospiraceae bacterium]|nr:signal peptidase II [Oscillospiraceae bacterium]
MGIVLAAALAAIDQLTKWLVVSNMQLHESIHLIKFGDTQVLNLSYYLNDGSAFSMFEGQTTMLIVVTCAMMTAMLVAMLIGKVKRTSYILAFSLVIGGGVGNLIDRVFNDGKVIDFIDVRIINFAIFNFADICAVCGGILLCVLVLLDEIRDRKAAKKAKAEGNDAEAAPEQKNDEASAVSEKPIEEKEAPAEEKNEESNENGND